MRYGLIIIFTLLLVFPSSVYSQQSGQETVDQTEKAKTTAPAPAVIQPQVPAKTTAPAPAVIQPQVPARTTAPAPTVIQPQVPARTTAPAPTVIQPASSEKATELVTSFVYPGRAGAPGNINIGRLKIHPGLDLGYTYTDNVLQRASGFEEEEHIFKITPGLDLQFPTSNHMFRLGYGLAIYDFLEMGKTEFKNSGMGSLEFNFPVGLFLRLSDNIAERVFPEFVQEQVGITEYWENKGYAEIGYKMTRKWSASGRYINQALRFQKPFSAADRDINSGGAALDLKLMTRLSLFGEAWYGHVGFDETGVRDRNADFVQGFFGLGGRYPKTNFTLKVGYENRTFRNPTVYPGTDEMVASLELEEKPNPLLSLSVNGSRSVHESVYESIPYYISTGGGANLTWNALGELSLGADFGYFFLRYPYANYAGVRREDRLFRISPNLRIDVTRWLRAQVGYTWHNRSSNINGAEYKENRIAASLNAVL